MNHRPWLSIAVIAATVLATSGCVATASDGYYGGGGYGYERPGDTVYIPSGGNNDRYYQDRDRRQWEREREQERDRQARERDRERERQARDRDRDRDQRARDEDRRRELDRQARERDRQQSERDRDNNRGSFGRSSSHNAECERYRNQVKTGSDTINMPSRPC